MSADSADIPTMDQPDETLVDYQRLSGIAYGTVFDLISTSARFNVADQIAADTVEQYLEAVAGGKEIHNPYAWVKIRAGWRAIDEMRRWERRKKRTRAIDGHQPNDQDFGDTLDYAVTITTGQDGDDPARIVEAQEWVRELIDAAYPDDSTNRRLAVACLAEGARPRDVAEDFDMDAKVIGNRLVRIRAKLVGVLLDTSEG
jgi:DNA-directed RNA polymerase specialized sigma24 family protein